MNAIATQTADTRGALWRLPRVMQDVGLSRSTIYRLEMSGQFPRRVRLSGNCVAWWSGQIEAWKTNRPPVDTS